MKKIAIAAVLCFLAVTCAAFGDDSVTSLRCHSDLISVGANKFEVLKKCGEPSHKAMTRSSVGTRDYVEIEEWMYNFGSMDFIHTLRFDGSTLIEIKRGGRGF